MASAASQNHIPHDPYNLQRDSPRHRSSLGFVLNLVLVISILGIGLLKLEKDWVWFKNQRLIYNSIQDGVAPADKPFQDQQIAVQENMKFKGKSMTAFFTAKWLPLLPAYLLAFLVPLMVGLWRLRPERKSRRRFHMVYFVFSVVFVIYASVFLADYFGYLKL